MLDRSTPFSCPLCGDKLERKEFATHYGLKLILDRCCRCGGYWTDKMEAVALDPNYRQDLTELFPPEKTDYSPNPKPLLCPKDKKQLKESDQVIHGFNYRLDYCPACGGIWFDPGELSAFKKFQTKNLEKLDRLEKKRILKKWEIEKGKSDFIKFMEDLNQPASSRDVSFSTLGGLYSYNLGINLFGLIMESLFRSIAKSSGLIGK